MAARSGPWAAPAAARAAHIYWKLTARVLLIPLGCVDWCSKEDAHTEPLLTCHQCHERHHAICYGFSGQADPRLPAAGAFVCYRCTRTDQRPDARTFSELALWRRCLYHVVHTGVAASDSELAKQAGIALFTARRINARLEKEGVVRKITSAGAAVPPAGRKGVVRRDGAAAIHGSGSSGFEVVSSAATELLFNAYFNGRLVASAVPSVPPPAPAAAAPTAPPSPSLPKPGRALPARVRGASAAPAPLLAAPPAPVTEVVPEPTQEQLVPNAISDTVARMTLDEHTPPAGTSTRRPGTVRVPPPPPRRRLRHGPHAGTDGGAMALAVSPPSPPCPTHTFSPRRHEQKRRSTADLASQSDARSVVDAPAGAGKRRKVSVTKDPLRV